MFGTCLGCSPNHCGGHGWTRFKIIAAGKEIYKKIFRMVSPDSVVVGGNTLYIDPLDSLGLLNSGKLGYEPSTTEIFKQEVRAGDIVVDIGANIGYFSILAANLVGPRGKVFAFEPNPETVNILRKNAATNNCKDIIKIVPKAVYKTSGIKLKFFLSDATSSLYHKTGGKPIEVETIALDDFFSDFFEEKDTNKIDLVKIDAEGAEPEIIQGMSKLLKHGIIKKLVVECNHSLLENRGIDPKKFISEIADLGYLVREVDANVFAEIKQLNA